MKPISIYSFYQLICSNPKTFQFYNLLSFLFVLKTQEAFKLIPVIQFYHSFKTMNDFCLMSKFFYAIFYYKAHEIGFLLTIVYSALWLFHGCMRLTIFLTSHCSFGISGRAFLDNRRMIKFQKLIVYNRKLFVYNIYKIPWKL